jgi:hypothetical protein
MRNLSRQNPGYIPSVENIIELLQFQEPGICYQNAGINGSEYMLGYSIGSLVLEALCAIGGPQSTMDVLAYGATDEKITFSEAFEFIYDISWEKAIPILAEYTAAQVAALN